MIQQELVYKIALLEHSKKVAEIPGPKSNPRIELYGRASLIHVDELSPWCANAMNFCCVTSALILDVDKAKKRLIDGRFKIHEVEEFVREGEIIAHMLSLPFGKVRVGGSFSIGTRSAAARSFLRISDPVKDGREGDFCCFSRTSNPVYGHIALYKKKGPLYRNVLGGNQGNQWSFNNYPDWRFLGYRRLL